MNVMEDSNAILEVFLLVAVKRDEDEEHGGESPEGGTSIADKWQRDADDRHQTDGHADVDEKMHEDAAGYTVAIDPGEGFPTPFSIGYYSPYQENIEQNHNQGPQESPFFAYCAENEVGTLLRNEAVCGLSPIKIALSCQTSRTDCNH